MFTVCNESVLMVLILHCLQVLTRNTLEGTWRNVFFFSPFLSPRLLLWGQDAHRYSGWSKTCTEHWGVTACPAHWLPGCLVRLFWLASDSPEMSWSLKWLECFLSVFSVEGTAEKCGFSRPLWLYNMYQPFPAAAAAAEEGALKTDFMCGLCHYYRQMDGAF